MIHDIPDPVDAGNVVHNPSFEAMRSFSEALETTTEFGSPCYVSEFRSRSADRTANAVDDEFADEDAEHVERAQRALRDGEFVCLDRRLGRDPELSFTCRLFVPKEHARIALSWATLLEPAEEGADPDFVTVQLPEWDDVRVRVYPDDGVTYVLGSDYTGEAKKSFLRLFMYYAKERGGLGLHAGSKRVRIRDADGDLRTVGQLFLGLSATGKTTLTCHGFGLDGEEEAIMLQDDVCALRPDGSVAGSEGMGMYIKTNDLSPDEHGPLYRAATQPGAVLENVAVDDDGTVDFSDGSLTTNGRASVLREDTPNAAADIDLEHADQVFFITRNPLMPPIAKLTPEEGAAAFMLGESIQTSAGDPEKAGEPIRVVGTNPFIVGSKGEEGNRFLELVRANDVDCFLINTGSVGGADVGVEDTVAILRGVASGAVGWRYDDRLGLRIPSEVPGIDVDAFYPPDRVEDYDAELADLHAERREYLAGFDDLDGAVVDSSLAEPVTPRQSD